MFIMKLFLFPDVRKIFELLFDVVKFLLAMVVCYNHVSYKYNSEQGMFTPMLPMPYIQRTVFTHFFLICSHKIDHCLLSSPLHST
jgi:hypothetical protein